MSKECFISALVLAFGMDVCATDYYVAPGGDDGNSGSLEAPFLSLKKAIQSAKPGTTVYLREGTYKPQNADIMREGAEGVYSCVFDLSAKGSAASPITISGYPGEKAVIDLSDVKPDARVMGFYVKGDYWRLKEFDIVGIQVTQTGHTQSINVGLFGGSNCVIERVNMHDGMGIGVYATKGNNNLVLNCDAYNNYDPVSENGAGGNCDGFGFHLNNARYTGNVVRGCRAWRNSDDGYDLINNLAPVTIENCWAWENGYDANKVSRGDGTGFKSGGYGMKSTVDAKKIPPRNIVRNCLSWSNKQNGFYANHHLGGLDFVNNTAYRNKRNFNMVNRKSHQEAVDVEGYGHNLTGNVSYKPTLADADCVNFDRTLSTAAGNSFFSDVTLKDADFESLDATQLLRPRKADGSLPDITFMKLKPTSAAFARKMGWQFPADTSAGISEITAGTAAAEGPVYTLSGIAVPSPSQGYYVKSGKVVYIP